MPSLKDAIEEKKFDVRLQDKNVGDGKLTRKDLDQYYKTLSDDEKNMTTTGKFLEQRVTQRHSFQDDTLPTE